MAKLLFKLNGVPEDEADDVRALLTEQQINYYETHAGKWGISVAAIWLKDESQLESAKKIIEDYEQQRSIIVQQHHEELKQQGQLETFWSRLFHRPFQFIAYALLMLFVIYLSTLPFVSF